MTAGRDLKAAVLDARTIHQDHRRGDVGVDRRHLAPIGGVLVQDVGAALARPLQVQLFGERDDVGLAHQVLGRIDQTIVQGPGLQRRTEVGEELDALQQIRGERLPFHDGVQLALHLEHVSADLVLGATVQRGQLGDQGLAVACDLAAFGGLEDAAPHQQAVARQRSALVRCKPE